MIEVIGQILCINALLSFSEASFSIKALRASCNAFKFLATTSLDVIHVPSKAGGLSFMTEGNSDSYQRQIGLVSNHTHCAENFF